MTKKVVGKIVEHAPRAAKKVARATKKIVKKSKKVFQKARKLFPKKIKSIDDVLRNPELLAGKTPAQVEKLLGKVPGWRIEKLGRGSKKGQGWVFREYTPKGNTTGRQLRWHPGGGHHGPDSYWRVISNSGKSGEIK